MKNPAKWHYSILANPPTGTFLGGGRTLKCIEMIHFITKNYWHPCKWAKMNISHAMNDEFLMKYIGIRGFQYTLRFVGCFQRSFFSAILPNSMLLCNRILKLDTHKTQLTCGHIKLSFFRVFLPPFPCTDGQFEYVSNCWQVPDICVSFLPLCYLFG